MKRIEPLDEGFGAVYHHYYAMPATGVSAQRPWSQQDYRDYYESDGDDLDDVLGPDLAAQVRAFRNGDLHEAEKSGPGYCPKCQSTNVTMTGVHGWNPWRGRRELGMPGGSTQSKCDDCGTQWNTPEKERVHEGELVDIRTAMAQRTRRQRPPKTKAKAWKLIHEPTGKELKAGDVVKDFRGDKHEILPHSHEAPGGLYGGYPPRHEGSTGRVGLRDKKSGHELAYYPGVINAKWVQEESLDESWRATADQYAAQYAPDTDHDIQRAGGVVRDMVRKTHPDANPAEVQAHIETTFRRRREQHRRRFYGRDEYARRFWK